MKFIATISTEIKKNICHFEHSWNQMVRPLCSLNVHFSGFLSGLVFPIPAFVIWKDKIIPFEWMEIQMNTGITSTRELYQIDTINIKWICGYHGYDHCILYKTLRSASTVAFISQFQQMENLNIAFYIDDAAAVGFCLAFKMHSPF